MPVAERTVPAITAVNQHLVILGIDQYHSAGPSAGPPAPGGGGANGIEFLTAITGLPAGPGPGDKFSTAAGILLTRMILA
jgi:hypothetical protein